MGRAGLPFGGPAPGTSDEPISIAQLIPGLDGAIVVTTPQEVALLDSRKAVNMFLMMNVPMLGIVENMSGLVCPHCGQRIEVFKTGGERMQPESWVCRSWELSLWTRR